MLKALLTVFLATLGFAQSNANATSLLRAVSNSVKATASWRIKGTFTRYKATATFSLAISPDGARFEEKGGSSPVLIVCDSLNAWHYFPPANTYRKSPSAGNPICSEIVAAWMRLPETLESPVLVGKAKYSMAGAAGECRVVEGLSQPVLKTAGRVRRKICIDERQELVIWEEAKTKYGSERYTYSRIERGTSVPVLTFVFDPPPGSRLTELQLPVPGPIGSPSIPEEPGVTQPRVLVNVQPKLDAAALRVFVRGAVILYVVINERGMPTEIHLVRSLAPAQDASAIEAVKQWRFAPATKNGQPIAYGGTLEINFQ